MNVYKIRKWFKARFHRNPSQDRSYYEEWKRRFENGTAFDRMDSESLEIWDRLFKKRGD